MSRRSRKNKARATSKQRAKQKTKEKVKKVMHEFKEGKLKMGKSGKKVRSRKQAIAIGLSEAREAGGKVPRPSNKGRKQREDKPERKPKKGAKKQIRRQ